MNIASNHLAGYSNNRASMDFYPTPTWATEALFTVEKFSGVVLEPAAGDGAMVQVIKKYNDCVSNDIVCGYDFLSETRKFPNVITNPPFTLAKEFVEKAKIIADEKIALFLKLAFLEGQSRVGMFRDVKFPLARVHVFSKRVTFHPNGIEDKNVAVQWLLLGLYGIKSIRVLRQ